MDRETKKKILIDAGLLPNNVTDWTFHMGFEELERQGSPIIINVSYQKKLDDETYLMIRKIYDEYFPEGKGGDNKNAK